MSFVVNYEDEQKVPAIATKNFHFGFPLKSTQILIERLNRDIFNLKLRIFLIKQRLGNSDDTISPEPVNTREIIKVLEEIELLNEELKEKQEVLESLLEKVEYREHNHNKARCHDEKSVAANVNRSIKLRGKYTTLIKKVNQRYLQTVETLSTDINSSSSSEIDMLRTQISNMQIKIDNLEQKSHKQMKVIDEQNCLMKALNVSSITFGIICLIVLIKKL